VIDCPDDNDVRMKGDTAMGNMQVMDEHSIETAGQLATTVHGDDVTHVIFILDRSGSMRGKEEDVIGGFNSYVDELRKTPHGEVGVSYVRFDQLIELVWNDVPLAGVAHMSRDTYSVRGSTALLDAVGMTVSAVRDNSAHQYIVITNTDGMENASREWTPDGVKQLIKDREALGNWTFAFFGEGTDAWSQASAYGFSANTAAAYSRADMRHLYEAKARVSNVMRSRKMRATKDFAAAAAAIMGDAAMSDDDVERILSGATRYGRT
jgi:uncharacterized protein YegL